MYNGVLPGLNQLAVGGNLMKDTHSDVPFVFQGSCSSEMRGVIMINGQTAQPESVDCKCCSGTGALEDVTFNCGFTMKVFQVTQMSTCGCNACDSKYRNLGSPPD